MAKYKKSAKGKRKIERSLDALMREFMTLDIKMGDKQITREVADELYFDPADLNSYTGDQPAKYAFYCTLYNFAKRELVKVEDKLDRFRDKVIKTALIKFKKNRGKTATKQDLHGYLLNKDDQYRKLHIRLENVKQKVGVLEGIVKAFDQRARLLKDAFFIKGDGNG